jgi:hypothetical protein
MVTPEVTTLFEITHDKPRFRIESLREYYCREVHDRSIIEPFVHEHIIISRQVDALRRKSGG